LLSSEAQEGHGLMICLEEALPLFGMKTVKTRSFERRLACPERFDMNSIELDRLGKAIARELLDSPQMRQLIREMNLLVRAEIDELNKQGIVRCFFHACEIMDIQLSLKGDKIHATNQHNFSEDMRRVLREYRADIIARLKDIEESKKAREEYLMKKAQSNGSTK
jgi:hypothetical protein